ncbi:MAG: zinc-binding dehydrogenase [Arachnia sp.]
MVAPKYVGLCGSDVSYARKGRNGSFIVEHPFVLGHEIVAQTTSTVEVAGETLPEGTVVAVHPLWPCPRPGESTPREEDAAEPTRFLGSASTRPHTNGGLAELVAVRPEQLRRLPSGLEPRTAALAEPLAVVLHAIGRLPLSLAGRDVLVCGAGPIGLLAVVVACARGARRVVVTDLHERPARLAVDLGASDSILVGHDAPLIDAVDVAIEASGAPASLGAGLDALRPGGCLLQLGMLPPELTLHPAPLITKELTVVGSHRFAGELDDALAFLAEHPECARIITHEVPLEEAERAIDLAADPTTSKVVVRVGG